MQRSALVLAQDMNEQGTDIGPRTAIRLTRALQHWRETGEQLVVAAGMSPRHPYQPCLMAEMMHDWLVENCCTGVAVLRNATLFNTEGELKAFFSSENDTLVGYRSSIISAPWHLIRVRDQVKSFFGRSTLDQLQWINVHANVKSKKDQILEPIKRGFFLATQHMSEESRHRLWLSGIQTLNRVGINSSY